MEKTIDTAKKCNELVDSLFNLRWDERCRGERGVKLRTALTTTLLEACSRMDVAVEVVDAVIADEEWVPAPATIRKHLRRLDYIEADVSERRDREIAESARSLQREDRA